MDAPFDSKTYRKHLPGAKHTQRDYMREAMMHVMSLLLASRLGGSHYHARRLRDPPTGTATGLHLRCLFPVFVEFNDTVTQSRVHLHLHNSLVI